MKVHQGGTEVTCTGQVGGFQGEGLDARFQWCTEERFGNGRKGGMLDEVRLWGMGVLDKGQGDTDLVDKRRDTEDVDKARAGIAQAVGKEHVGV